MDLHHSQLSCTEDTEDGVRYIQTSLFAVAFVLLHVMENVLMPRAYANSANSVNYKIDPRD